MFLPPEYVWLEPIIIVSVIVFFVTWIGNTIFSGNNFVNAILVALIFGLIFAGLDYFGLGTISVSFDEVPVAEAPALLEGNGAADPNLQNN